MDFQLCHSATLLPY